MAKGGGKNTPTTSHNISYVEVKSDKIDKITKSPTFLHRPITGDGQEFFYFRKIGDSIQGFLGRSCDNTEINRTCSFIIDTDQGPEQFFANKLLQQLLHELHGQYIKIVYVGDQQTQFGHRRKIYRVYKSAGTGSALINAGQTEDTKKQRRKKHGPEHKKQPNARTKRPDRANQRQRFDKTIRERRKQTADG